MVALLWCSLVPSTATQVECYSCWDSLVHLFHSKMPQTRLFSLQGREICISHSQPVLECSVGIPVGMLTKSILSLIVNQVDSHYL